MVFVVCERNNAMSKHLTTDEYITFLENLGYNFSYDEGQDEIYVNGKPMDKTTMALIRCDLRDASISLAGLPDILLVAATDNTFNSREERALQVMQEMDIEERERV